MQTHANGRTTDELEMNKSFAAPYREDSEEVDPEKIGLTTLEYHTLDMTYRTTRGTKTVRSINATGQASYNDIPEGFASFYHDGRKYAYNPEEQRLITVNRNGQNKTVATAEDFVRFESVSYPEQAVVKGAVDDGVEATVYYRSPVSDRMQSVTIEVDWMEGQAHEINGTEVGSGRRIKAYRGYERDIVSQHGTTERHLGKVARIEFPRGHQFTVTVEGLKDSLGGEAGEERISKYVNKAFRRNGVRVDVEHDGRAEWED